MPVLFGRAQREVRERDQSGVRRPVRGNLWDIRGMNQDLDLSHLFGRLLYKAADEADIFVD
jgi:hypothetical protein